MQIIVVMARDRQPVLAIEVALARRCDATSADWAAVDERERRPRPQTPFLALIPG